MGVAYAPFDDPVPPPVPSFRSTAAAPPSFERDATECNYLVMFFVAGVFLMALADSSR
jgi:hypothetical protein